MLANAMALRYLAILFGGGVIGWVLRGHKDKKDAEMAVNGPVMPQEAPEAPKVENESTEKTEAPVDEILTNYTAFSAEVDEAMKDLAEAESPKEEEESNTVRVVTPADYTNLYPTFDEKHFTYYEGNDMLMDDETDEMIDNPISTFGTAGWRGLFGMMSDDPDLFCVVNPRYGAKYEVARKHGTYGD